MTALEGSGGPVRVGDLLEAFIAELWEATLAHRASRGEPPPPAHLRPTSSPADTAIRNARKATT